MKSFATKAYVMASYFMCIAVSGPAFGEILPPNPRIGERITIQWEGAHARSKRGESGQRDVAVFQVPPGYRIVGVKEKRDCHGTWTGNLSHINANGEFYDEFEVTSTFSEAINAAARKGQASYAAKLKLSQDQYLKQLRHFRTNFKTLRAEAYAKGGSFFGGGGARAHIFADIVLEYVGTSNDMRALQARLIQQVSELPQYQTAQLTVRNTFVVRDTSMGFQRGLGNEWLGISNGQVTSRLMVQDENARFIKLYSPEKNVWVQIHGDAIYVSNDYGPNPRWARAAEGGWVNQPLNVRPNGFSETTQAVSPTPILDAIAGIIRAAK